MSAREIEFRALCQLAYIQDENLYSWVHWTPFGGVNPSSCVAETLGQYTGIKDANGVKVFEGDVVQWDDDEVGVVVFNERELQYAAKAPHFLEPLMDDTSFTVIGNIHQHPELLEVSK